MRFSVLLAAIVFYSLHNATAQTRRIAHGSHSGTGMMNEADNFGISPAMLYEHKRLKDSVNNASRDSAQHQKPRTRPKQQRGQDSAGKQKTY